MQSVKKYIVGLILLAALAIPNTAGAGILWEKQTEHNHLILKEDRGLYCLFTKNDSYMNVQGCIHQDKPLMIVPEHTRALMSALLLVPEPKRVLIIGMGMGVVPMSIKLAVPNAFIETIEIDRQVVKISRELFFYEEDEFARTYITDGPTFIANAIKAEAQYDLVIINALTAKYLPDEMMSREFLEAIRSVMTHGAVIAVNTLIGSRLYDNESVTYSAVFGSFFNFRTDGGHRIILAANGPGPTVTAIQNNAMRYASTYLHTFGINVNELLTKMDDEPDWQTSAKIITASRTATDIVKGPIKATIDKHKALFVVALVFVSLLFVYAFIKLLDAYVAKKNANASSMV